MPIARNSAGHATVSPTTTSRCTTASRCKRALDGREVNALHRSDTLAVFEHEEHGLHPALVLLQQRHFVEGRGSKLQVFVLNLLSFILYVFTKLSCLTCNFALAL